MIKFTEVRYKNLMSSGNQFTVIPLNKAATTLITGGNGSGKSTIVEAITFALFGKPYRAINKPDLVNTINGKGTLVELDFEIGGKKYMIRRGIKPNVFEIWIDGEMRNQEAASKDDQAFLEEVVLQLNYKTFCQIAIIGNTSYTPFMQLGAAARRDIVEDLLDIKIFSKMNAVLKEDSSVTKTRIRDIEQQIAIQTAKIDTQKAYIGTLLSDRSRKVEETKANIASAESLIAECQQKIAQASEKRESYATLLSDSEAVVKKQTQLTALKSKLSDNVDRLAEEIQFFKDHDDCPTCQQGISADFRAIMVTERETKSEGVQAGLTKMEAVFAEVSARIAEITATNRKIAALNEEIRDQQSEVSTQQRYIAMLNQSIAQEMEKSGNIDEEQLKLQTLAKEAVELVNVKGREVEKKHYEEIAALVLKDNGIKAKVIKEYVPVINALVNKYLSQLDFFAHFELDETFKDKIKYRERDDLTYWSYSEGEKLKIDLSILFTWITIAKLKNTVSTNLIFLDEVTDAGLDTASSGLIVGILSEFAREANVFVISHHPELYADHFEDHLQFAKVNNYSTLVEK